MSHKITADTKKNVLFIQIGVVEKNNFPLFRENIKKQSDRLKPGFTCITDFRSFHVDFARNTSSDFNDLLAFVQEELEKKGVVKFIRIVPPQSLVISQILLRDFEKKRNYDFVCSMDEANEIISRL
ncbi:MAG: hypothetical protein H6681_02125 [Desulfobacteraceae bacterium]|nr:hypothetical protein [Desulfobacteraceae bacterium]